MEIRFNRTGEERKALVKAIGEILDIPEWLAERLYPCGDLHQPRLHVS